MFDFLKKKIDGFVDKLTKKEEEKPQEKEPAPVEKPPDVEPEKPEPEVEKEKVEAPKPAEVKPEEPPVVEEPPPKVEEPAPEVETTFEEPVPKVEPPEKKPEPKVEPPAEKPPEPEKIREEVKPKERMKIGTLGAIKSLITSEVDITENDVSSLLEEFELELLEADVEISVAEAIKDELKEKLVGSKIKKGELHSYINKTMKETLVDMMVNENAFDILEKTKELEKPLRIMFLGVNGAGKTTTIAKVAKLLLNNNYKVVFAAADTFRAAAIEQMQVHADRLDVRLIKRDYGSDPTSVAYDAVNYAKAHGIDVVLIDTAGRQDTNIGLINEMKKMSRVIEPDLTIYIGESISGNAIIEQISSFNKEIGIDAVILTKLDCDPKGGTMLSINKVTGVPIIYVGIGQRYEDLELFNAQDIVERLVE
jgi:fused signal recognition particle receptor